jgi:hypothetical protein
MTPSGESLLTRNSPGHALCTAPLPPHVRHQRLAQLCAQLLQGRLRRNQAIPGRGPGHRAAPDRAIGRISYPVSGTSQDRSADRVQTLCSIIKWCWSRLPGGVVTWDAYELFRIGEHGECIARCECGSDTFLTKSRLEPRPTCLRYLHSPQR